MSIVGIYKWHSNVYALTLSFILLLEYVKSTSIDYEQICGNVNSRRRYVELGKKGIITAKYEGEEQIDRQNQIFESYKQCRLELMSCPSCIISLKFTFLNTSRSCNVYSIVDSCTCDYVWINEPPFQDISGQQFCGHYANINLNDSLLIYRSKTRTVTVIFFYTRLNKHVFSLQYSAERNRQIFHKFHNHTEQIISTPYFPYRYSNDLSMEFVIHCGSNEKCWIRLIFVDFLLAKMSVVEFFDWKGRRLNVATGLTFRPASVVASGPTLCVRFYANGAANKGFKAEYAFLSMEDVKDVIIKPKMDCGGLVDNLGGGITMMKVINKATQEFDCIWILQPSRSFFRFYTHIYLKVVAFSDFDSQLSIHRGLTSSGTRMEILKYHPLFHLSNTKQKQHVLPISEAFYVRFKGIFRPESELVIAYTAFNYNGCVIEGNFLCKNQRCIPIYLQCDGIDHCGDNSDEAELCLQDADYPRRLSHASNFFFPNVDRYSDARVAVIAFVICCFGLICLIMALIVLIFRVTGRIRQQREMVDHLQAITDLLDQETASIQEEIIEDDDPPVYEAPPNYDEIENNKLELPKRQVHSNKRVSTEGFRGSCSRCSEKSKITSSRYHFKILGPREENIVDCIGDGAPEVSQMTHTTVDSTFNTFLMQNANLTGGCSTSSKNCFDTKQRFFTRCFKNDDFDKRTTKFSQKSKIRNKTKTERVNQMFSLDFQEADYNRCLSDSDILEINSMDVGQDVSLKKLRRSFSFDDL